MSVLVFKDGVFAADTAGFQGTFRTQLEMRKVIRSPSGSLIGGAGRLRYIQMFQAWDEGRGNGPPPPGTDNEDDFGGIVVHPDGTVHEYDNDMTVVDSTFAGWAHEGDGWEFCFALHTLGWSAEQIVAHAIKYCVWAGGEVYSLRLGEIPEDSGELHPELAEELGDALGWRPMHQVWTEPKPDPAINRFLEDRGLE